MGFIKRADWEQSLKNSIREHLEKISSFCENAENFKTAAENIEDYILGIDGCEKISSLNYTSVNNINSGFRWTEDFGQRIGFIDTGVIFKKGKNGVLFCKNGITIKPAIGNGVSIDFNKLCAAIIEDSGHYLVAENKFSVTEENGITVIDSTSVMLDRFNSIRKILLSSSKEHRDCFCGTLKKLADETHQKIIEDCFEDALSSAKKLYRFSIDTYPELANFVNAIRSVASMLNNHFESAKNHASNSGSEEFKSFIESKIVEFDCVSAMEFYEKAKSEYDSGEPAKAWKTVLGSVHKHPTAENWQLYFDCLYTTANESNQYNHTVLSTFKSPNVDKSDAKTEILIKESIRIAELEKKYEEYSASLCSLIPEKIIKEDIDFFKQNPNLITSTDKYGMNAVMYAVLYRKEYIYQAINEAYPIGSNTNVLGHTINDIAAFKGELSGINADVWKKYNKKFIDRYEEYQSDLKWAERKEKFADFTSSLADSAYKSAMKNQNYSGAVSAVETSSNADSLKSEAEKSIGDIKNSFYEDAQKMFESAAEKVKSTAVMFAQKGTLKVEKNQALPSFEEVKASPEYAKKFSKEKTDFINSYISKNLAPKGEFEKTVQFEERKARINENAQKEFEANIVSIEKLCYGNCIADVKEKTSSTENTNLKIELAKIYFKASFNGVVSLGTYDADKEEFIIMRNDYSSALSIPIETASDFKSCFAETGIDYYVDDIIIISENNKTKIKYLCLAKFKEQTYPFEFTEIEKKG